MTNVRLYVMLVLLNMTIELSNLNKKKIREPKNVTSTVTQLDVILVLSNLMMV